MSLRLPPRSLGLLLVPVVGVAGCSDDAVGASGGGDGIESIGGASSSGTEGMLTGSTGDADETTGEPPPCANGEQDGDETDVDCGGGTCDPCGPGGTCGSDDDCDTMICSGGFCQTPTCYDGLQNGSEEGIDCGGTCPNECVGDDCRTDNQCGDGFFCLDGNCLESSCENMMQDTLESDVDCGGADCPDCGPGQACNSDADCTTMVCGDDGLCADPMCDDGAINGDETDVDCGGLCPPCPNGGSCLDPGDCVEGVCEMGTCQDDTCMDMVFNGEETDQDCGGPECPECEDGLMCGDGTDCVSGVCMGNVCVPPACNDMVFNGDETDLDCGGSCGPTCIPGQDCDGSGDCVEGVCEFGACSNPDCSDGVANGTESDVDCGGVCGATCIPGEQCNGAGDCEEGVCVVGVCALPTCMDAVENGDESDVDCGGACGPTCVPGENCSNGGDCTEGVCVLGVCQAPTCNDGVQNGVELGVDCSGNCDQPCPVGGEITVNTTLPDFQVQPAVAAPPGGGFYAVTWASFPVLSPPQDGDGAGIFVRTYDPFGIALTGEVLVNATTIGNQSFPAIDANDAGFVIVWQGPDADGNGVFAQRFNAGGFPVGGEIPVAEDPLDEQRRPDVAIENGGTFVVCWEDEPFTFDILCRRFSAGGVPLTPEIVVNTITADQQNLPVVEIADTGDFTVAWQSAGDQDGDLVGIFQRRFDSAGVPLGGAETQVNQYTANNQQGPAIGMTGAGNYVIAWSSEGQDGSSTGIYARAFDSAGLPATAEFAVNTTTVGAQNNPTVALGSGGDYVIAWQTADDGVLTGVFAQRYDQGNTPYNAEFIVNPTVIGLQEEPDVTIRGADEIVATWSEGDVGFTDRNIRLQRYIGEFP